MRKIENVRDWFQFENDVAKNAGKDRVSIATFGLSLCADKEFNDFFAVTTLRNDGPPCIMSVYWTGVVASEDRCEKKTSEKFFEEVERHFGLPFYIADVGVKYDWL